MMSYSYIVFGFATVNMASLAFEKIFQSVGRMKVTMVALIVGCVGNIILDPLLIFGIGPFPAMGIAGAALATGIGQALSTGIYLVVYASTELPVRLRRACLKLDKELDTRLYSISILLAAFSGSYVVVLGIYYKLQTFLYLPANGIVQGMRPLISYNYGAGEHKRVRRLYQITLILSAAIMAAGTLGCLVASEPLMRLFTSTPETVEAGKVALRIICLGFVVSAISTTSSGALEGLGKGTQSLVISLCRYIVFIMPLAWVLCRQFGPVGVWNAFWATEVLSPPSFPLSSTKRASDTFSVYAKKAPGLHSPFTGRQARSLFRFSPRAGFYLVCCSVLWSSDSIGVSSSSTGAAFFLALRALRLWISFRARNAATSSAATVPPQSSQSGMPLGTKAMTISVPAAVKVM